MAVFKGNVVLVEVAEFCGPNFGVTFPLTANVDVGGEDQNPLWTELTKSTDAGLPDRAQWSFEKFLVNRDGGVMARFAPAAEPDSPEVVDAAQAAMA